MLSSLTHARREIGGRAEGLFRDTKGGMVYTQEVVMIQLGSSLVSLEAWQFLWKLNRAHRECNGGCATALVLFAIIHPVREMDWPTRILAELLTRASDGSG